MKAEERHRLKTNELAQKLAELPVWFKANARTLVIFGSVVVIAAVVVVAWWKLSVAAREQRAQELVGLLSQANVVQIQAVNIARTPEAEGIAPGVRGYDAQPVTSALDRLARESDGAMAAVALLQQAQLVRGELYFSQEEIAPAEREQVLRRADSLYQQAAEKAAQAQDGSLRARAMMGRALVAEDLGEYDQAKLLYEEIAAGGKELAGTAEPLLAKRRLAMWKEISEPVTLPAGSTIPVEEPEEPAQPAEEAVGAQAPDAVAEPAAATPVEESTAEPAETPGQDDQTAPAEPEQQ